MIVIILTTNTQLFFIIHTYIYILPTCFDLIQSSSLRYIYCLFSSMTICYFDDQGKRITEHDGNLMLTKVVHFIGEAQIK
jgi:hypothetical protein